ncbi:MAG: glutamate racemase [Clostridiales bacterium]|nr:glutamate racemase [Clostridiales bacterium]
MNYDNRPIGVFDSGIGGLTVFNEIKKAMPDETVVYFGDCGRAPYGIKSPETILKFTFQDVRFLLGFDIKLMVIACNTASAYGYEQVSRTVDIPVVEVVGPGAACAITSTLNGKIGVIGTPATIKSGVYEKAILKASSAPLNINILSKACPLFVNLVEEGWWDNEIAHMVAKEYLNDLFASGIDTLVLGCTHYPLLERTISKIAGGQVTLVNSAKEVALSVRQIISDGLVGGTNKFWCSENTCCSDNNRYRFFTSDSVDKFQELSEKILGFTIDNIEKIDIEKY